MLQTSYFRFNKTALCFPEQEFQLKTYNDVSGITSYPGVVIIFVLPTQFAHKPPLPSSKTEIRNIPVEKLEHAMDVSAPGYVSANVKMMVTSGHNVYDMNLTVHTSQMATVQRICGYFLELNVYRVCCNQKH